MPEKPESALVPVGQYAIVSADAETLRQVVADNLGAGGNITPFDLDRVRVPAGGGTTWEIPGLEGVTESKELLGIVAYWRDGKSYWATSIDESGGGAPPDCASEDGITGRGDPGGDCGRCPFSVFGSDLLPNGQRGRGKACKDLRLLFICRPTDLLPLVLQVPPTSLGSVKKYFLRLASGGVPYYGVVTRFTLGVAKNAAGIKYSQIEAALATRLTPEQTARLKEFSESLRPVFAQARMMDRDELG